MKKNFVLILLTFGSIALKAQPPGYYTSALGKNGALLQTALKNIIDNHTSQSFPLWGAFGTTDNKGSNILWDMYSDIPGGTSNYTYTIGSDQCGQYNSEGDCYNHEHVWPKTYFNDAFPMNSDLHHVIPTDGWVNNKRGNFPIGEVSTTAWSGSNGSQTGTSSSYTAYTGQVFEPIDEYKGDFARMYFYMSTRYKGEDIGWKNWEMANGAELSADAVQLLLQWHHDDTVSQKEISRNTAIFNIQGNRNPFVDYPIFADCIWGTTDCTPLDIEEVLLQSIQVFPNPVNDNIKVKIPDALQNEVMQFEVYDFTGKQVLTTTNQAINIKEFPKGFYVLRVLMGDKNATVSFIKR